MRLCGKNGRNDDRGPQNDTALHFAAKTLKSRKLAEADMLHLAQTLLEAGIDRNAPDGDGKRAIELATENNYTQLAQLLSAK